MSRLKMVSFLAGVCLAGAVGAKAADEVPVKVTYPTVRVTGDMRYRFEQIDEEGKDVRNRDRIRLRAGVLSEVNETVKAEARLATGGKDPVSSYATLAEGGSRKDIGLDLAWLEWNVQGKDMARVGAGKMRMPMVCPSELIWDSDANPEGLAVKAQQAYGDWRFGLNAAYLWLAERSAAHETKVYSGQVVADGQAGSGVKVTLGGGVYIYDNMKGEDVLDWQGRNTAYGNSTVAGSVSGAVTNKAYATDFTVLEGFVRMETAVLGVPFSLLGQYVVNARADDYDTGYLAGCALGKLKDPGSFELSYDFRRLEKDATPGFLTDSSFVGGGTDGRGHAVRAGYQVSKGWNVSLTAFVNDKMLSESDKTRDYTRIQADVTVKF